MKKIYGLFAVLAMLGACASTPDMDDWSAEEIYNHAYEELEATRYKKAAEAFEKLEADHPYSQWAVKAKLMAAYAYYKDEKYDEAIIATERFLKYHPGNKDADYAYYLKGMCYYDQISSAEKGQGDTALAQDVFTRLIALYPDSKYAADARKKMNLAEDYRAGQEMIIGRYYLKDGNYLSALNRFNVVLEDYQTTVQIEEALYRQVEIYAIWGMNKYADGYYKILRDNYPDGKWTAKAAKIMEKIGKDDPAPRVKPAAVVEVEEVATVKEPTAEEKKSSWFSGWFGGDKEEAAAPVEEVATVKEPAAEEKKSSWFSGWFGGDKEEAAAPVEEVQAEVEEVATVEEPAAEEKKYSWFSGWFNSSEETTEKEEVIEENSSEKSIFLSHWFGVGSAEAAEPEE